MSRSTQEKLDLMWKRFVHDDDAWFAMMKYKEDVGETFYFPMRSGWCEHEPKHSRKDCPDVKVLTFNKDYMLEHLQGKATYAPYQVSKDNKVKWLCLDIDYGDKTADAAIRLCREIHKLFGKNTYLVEFSGSKGYHVWLFFDEPLPAGFAMSLGHMLSQRIDVPLGAAIEVYPKQASRKLTGNAVKLPLGVHQKTGNRCMFFEPTKEGLVEYKDQWQALENVVPLASEMVMSRFSEFESDKPRDRSTPENVPSCLMDIMDNGVHAGFKDEPAFRLACYLRSKGIPEYLATSMLQEWNLKNDEPIHDDVLERKIDSAYSDEYSYLPCGSVLFDHICVSTCPFYKGKERIRWKRKDKSSIGVICRE